MPSDDQRVGLKHPGLMLKYSTFKNLASMAALRDDLETAMEFYLEVMCHFNLIKFNDRMNNAGRCSYYKFCSALFSGCHVGFH